MEEALKRLAAKVHDKNLISYYYLDRSLEEVVDTLEALEFSRNSKAYDIPFNAAVKGYLGATDSQGQSWIVKPLVSEKEIFYHRVTEIVYLLDFQMATLSAPTKVLTIGGKKFRGAKTVEKAIQISSYDYLQQPFCNILLSDLVNRWLQFDEDRNPNNYMVVTNSKSEPLVIAIDFDKSDLENTSMKIVGTEDKFGWVRHEKNRYLTMLKPENFENASIDVFETRLSTMMAIDMKKMKAIMERLFTGYTSDPQGKAEIVAANLETRRNYIDKYFRNWIKAVDQVALKKENDDYGSMGKTFMKIYQGKK
jgi:hypothetical protein